MRRTGAACKARQREGARQASRTKDKGATAPNGVSDPCGRAGEQFRRTARARPRRFRGVLTAPDTWPSQRQAGDSQLTEIFEGHIELR